MFKVDADSVSGYLAFDPTRKADLDQLDSLIRSAAPHLKRYFHPGTPPGEPGMRFKMIGYGRFQYAVPSGKVVEWPVVGVALQKNYISVYLTPSREGRPLTDFYAGRLGELRSGRGNFSFAAFADLDSEVAGKLFAEAQHLFEKVPASMAGFNLVG